MARRLVLGTLVMPNGHHGAGWRHPDARFGGDESFDFYRGIAQTLERGLFDVLFLQDQVCVRDHGGVEVQSRANITAHLEPLTLLSALSVVTRNLGLVATASTTYNEPYHVARLFASLDHLSGGRAGWNAVTSFTDAEAHNFGREAHLDHDTRYDRAREFVGLVRDLWDSWDDDAFVRDKASGRYFLPGRLHVLNHRGRHFAVKGPLNVPRSPQGHPVIFQAGASADGLDLAAATAEVVYAAAQAKADAQAYYTTLKARAAALGRPPGLPLILPGLHAIVGRTEAEAKAKYRALLDLVDPVVGLAQLSMFFTVDLSGHPLDGPVPDVPLTQGHRSRQKLLLDLARRENLTLRQLIGHVANGLGHLTIVGTAARIADVMQDWFQDGAADGFNILPPYLPGGIDDFVDLVVPELQARGLTRTAYDGRTLRENLGLARPANRFTPAPAPAALAPA
ncbi:LLM class flavin-dependent oxidoreductase [Zavarzinia sp. CC-PAN008]|uniref:LLM class flavin-dependent oxidoreductase n=1 Tax=Zavarzinia sp. CC-PAN008 TaxID=3243332 RepID=UPI003F74A592